MRAPYASRICHTSPVAVIRASCRSQAGCPRSGGSARNSFFAWPNAVRALDCSAGDPIEVRPCSNRHSGTQEPSRLPAVSRIRAVAVSVSPEYSPRSWWWVCLNGEKCS